MRNAYIAKQKQENGRKVLAVLPISYPKEILTAMNILAVEIWGPPGPPRSAEAGRIQTYVCPIVRNALGFMAGGGIQAVDGVLFPHTCDSIQGLATQLPDLGEWPLPVFNFIHPKGDDRPSMRRYLKQELLSFAGDLQQLTGTVLDPAKLADAIRLHREIDALRMELIGRRRYVPQSDKEFYGALRKGEYLWPEEYLAELQELKKGLSDQPVQTGTPIMISGIVPEPMSIYDNLNEAGAVVVADDYAAIGRRITAFQPVQVANDPFDTLVELYFKQPPCSTREGLIDPRRDYLMMRFRESEAQGVILHNIKFCEPELFDVPHLRKRFAEENIPLLYMEGELETELSGQAITRLEAFVEMASNGRRQS